MKANRTVHVAFYPSDWLAGTRGLTAAETGVYITLVAMMYERQEPLAIDRARLARLCGLPAGTFKKVLAVLLEEEKIVEVEAGLWNRRVEKELARVDEKSGKAREAAEARWRSDERENATVKPQSDEQQDDSPDPEKPKENSDPEMQTQCGRNANQNQSQSKKDPPHPDSTREVDDLPPDKLPGEPADKPPAVDDPTFRERLLSACGADASGLTGRGGSRLCDRPQMIEAERWRDVLGLSEDEIVVEVERIVSRKRDGPPTSLIYFRSMMERLAGQLEEARTVELRPAASRAGGPGHPAPSTEPRGGIGRFHIVPNIPPEFQDEES